MNSLFQGYSLPLPQKACATKWQDDALKACQYLDNPSKSQIFLWFKVKETKITAALNYMKSKNIHSMGYLIVMMQSK